MSCQKNKKGVPSAMCLELGYPHKATGNGNYRQLTLIASPRHLICVLVGLFPWEFLLIRF